MNLVCFSNNTAGGLLCDLLNGNKIEMQGYKTTNQEHSKFKVLDTPSVQRTLNVVSWNFRIEQHKNSNSWFGTHCHPSAIPDLSVFNRVIAITTETRESKLYRWLRYYHGWFKSYEPNWQETDELESIDKVRELAKDVFEAFESHPGCENLEFSDIVNGNYVRDNALDVDQFLIWKQANPWLYTDDETWAVKRFNEAEWELTNNLPYRYV